LEKGQEEKSDVATTRDISAVLTSAQSNIYVEEPDISCGGGEENQAVGKKGGAEKEGSRGAWKRGEKEKRGKVGGVDRKKV